MCVKTQESAKKHKKRMKFAAPLMQFSDYAYFFFTQTTNNTAFAYVINRTADYKQVLFDELLIAKH